MKLNCILVDDEPFSRKGIAEYVAEIDYLSLRSQCENATEASRIISREKIDLVFLDIQMPGISGLELLQSLQLPPLAILITAYPEYALEGFGLDVIDYLLKPVSFERFLKACNKAKDYFSLQQASSTQAAPGDYFFVKADQKIEKVFFADILYVKALQNYVEIFLKDRRLVSYLTFKNIEAFLPAEQFVKIQKSYIVAVAHIDRIAGNEIIIGQQHFSISRQHKEKILESILQNRYLKR